jgi:hypothetical protein
MNKVYWVIYHKGRDLYLSPKSSATPQLYTTKEKATSSLKTRLWRPDDWEVVEVTLTQNVTKSN